MSHAAADDDGVYLVNHVVYDIDFIGNLGTAQNSHEGALGSFKGVTDEFDFLFNEVAGNGGNEFGDSLVGGMATVSAAEGIVYGDVSQLCKLLGEARVVFLFFGMEAEIFQQENIAWLQLGGGSFGYFTYAVGGEGYFLAQKLGEALGYRSQRHFGDDLSFRAAEMAGEDEGGALLQQIVYGRQGSADALVVGDFLLIVQGNIEVGTDKYLFALDLNIFD